MIGFRSLLPYAIAALIVILAAATRILWTARKKRLAASAGPPPVPPEVAAREALEALLASGLLERAQMKPFYTELGDIPRRYLEGRFDIPALDRTTSELLPELRRLPELKALYPDTRVLLENCDLVKFAKYSPGPEAVQADIGRVRRFVEEASRR